MFSGRPRSQRWRRDRARVDHEDYRISWHLDGEPCEVFLFKRWGSYSHPVLPLDPLTPAEAVRRGSLCRAYVREFAGEPLMVQFACFAAHDTDLVIPTPLPPGVYAVDDAPDGAIVPGPPLDRIAAAMSSSLILVDGSTRQTLRRLEWAYTYGYEYGADGALTKLHLSSERGSRTIPRHATRAQAGSRSASGE